MKKELREQAKRIGNPAYRDKESTCYTCDELDELITLIRTATLDEVKEVVSDKRSEFSNGGMAEFGVETALEAIDNLRGESDE